MKERFERTNIKHKNAVVVIPDMDYYRTPREDDRKQKGDLFNIGKYNGGDDEFVLATCMDGKNFCPWESYYIVMKDRNNLQ